MNLARKKKFWLCSFNIITLFLCFNACMNIRTVVNLLLIFQICKNNIFLTFNTGAWRVPGAGPVLFGRGMLSINPKTLRSLSSEIRRDNRGSVPDILYLEHTYRYIHKTYFEYPDYKKTLTLTCGSLLQPLPCWKWLSDPLAPRCEVVTVSAHVPFSNHFLSYTENVY